MNVPLDTSQSLMKYIGSLHSYLHCSLLLFEPKFLDEASVKVVHLKGRENHDQDDQPNMEIVAKRRGENPSCTHFRKKGMMRRIDRNYIHN